MEAVKGVDKKSIGRNRSAALDVFTRKRSQTAEGGFGTITSAPPPLRSRCRFGVRRKMSNPDLNVDSWFRVPGFRSWKRGCSWSAQKYPNRGGGDASAYIHFHFPQRMQQTVRLGFELHCKNIFLYRLICCAQIKDPLHSVRITVI